jgi:large subunit ribosomal protein L10
VNNLWLRKTEEYMKRSEKEQIVSEIVEKLARSKGLFFTDFSGLTVEQATELRREFRKSGVDYRVVKNTLARKALEEVTGYDKMYDALVGPTGIAFAFDDPAAPAKVIKKFRDKYEKLQLKAAVLESTVYAGSQLSLLAALPSRNEMIASILGSLNAPVSGVVGAINAVMRDLVNVIDQIEKKKAA